MVSAFCHSGHSSAYDTCKSGLYLFVAMTMVSITSKTLTKSADLFQILDSSMGENNIDSENCAGTCTDRACLWQVAMAFFEAPYSVRTHYMTTEKHLQPTLSPLLLMKFFNY